MRVPLFVELCAGTAAISLMLQGGRYARPPVSRMGSKRGYAAAILECLGLRPGQGADGYLWCEPDDGCRAMLIAYGDRGLLDEAAAIIRGWADEEPRALWERLRAEGPIRGADGGEVARWAFVAGAAFIQGDPSTAYAGDPGANGGRMGDVRTRTAARLDALPDQPPTAIAADARAVDPARLPEGSVVYIDPPYVGTTGYTHDLGRAEVVTLARRWADAGALVVVSEAEPVSALVAEGWHAVEITGCRVGQKRTFSKQQREWITMSRPPAWTPSVQESLF